MEKYKKDCFNAKINDFDHRTACRAPIRWSKYTTVHTPVHTPVTVFPILTKWDLPGITQNQTP